MSNNAAPNQEHLFEAKLLTQKSYSVSSACKIAGVSSRQLYYWESLGIVSPFYEQFGSYFYRRYPEYVIKALLKIKTLMDQGYTLRAAAQRVTGKDFNGKKNGSSLSHDTPNGSNGHES